MNVELEYGSEVILKEIASEVLEIKKDYCISANTNN